MVALHNRKLSINDILPDNLWDDEMWSAKRNEFLSEMRKEGVPEISFVFELSRRMQEYQSRFPSYREQQEIMRRIYPPVRSSTANLALTEEELSYLLEKLSGVNDPIGQDILVKVQSLLSIKARDRS